MRDQFPVFEVSLKKRGRRWMWAVGPIDSVPIMLGSEASRWGARYKANGALFLLLLSHPVYAVRHLLRIA